LPSTSFTSPTSAVNDAGGGTTSWTITSVTNCVCPVDKTTSNYLEMTGYGFSIPTGSSITGVEVSISCGNSGGTTQPTLYAQLLKAGALAGVSKSLFPLASTTFGGSADLWSATWSEAEAENSGFGVSIWLVGGSNGNTVTVTGATIKIHYTTGGPSGPPGSSTSGHFLFNWI
jgi:hypothetical protein